MKISLGSPARPADIQPLNIAMRLPGVMSGTQICAVRCVLGIHSLALMCSPFGWLAEGRISSDAEFD